jgi:hypothetical protein
MIHLTIGQWYEIHAGLHPEVTVSQRTSQWTLRIWKTQSGLYIREINQKDFPPTFALGQREDFAAKFPSLKPNPADPEKSG